MSAQIVVDISSDEDDNAVKRSTKPKSTAKPSTDPTRTIVKTAFRIPPTADKPTVSAPMTTGCSQSPASTQPRNHQSTATTPPRIHREQEAPKDQTLPAVQTTTVTRSTPSTITTPPLPPPPPTIVDEPPKPTPLDINVFRHLVCAGSVPAAKDSPLIMSIQPVASSTKRKATDALDDSGRRPRPASPLPPTPYTGTSERPVPPKRNNNSLLWSVPAYKPPPSVPPTPSQSTSTTSNPPPTPSPLPLIKQPSIPNIHAPLTAQPPPIAPLPTPTVTTITTPSAPIATQTLTPQRPRRHRESKWTHAQLANLASAIETAFAPAMENFAKENKKTLGQVRETYSFLVNGRIFEFSDEGREDGDGKGRGKGRGVARRFEREMRGGRKAAQNLMKQVHKREASEGHWASFGMPPQPPGEKEKCKEKCKEKGKQSVKKCGSGGGGGLERTTTIQ